MRRFESFTRCHVGASFISLAPTYFIFYKSERAHAAAPPFQTGPAALGFDLDLGEIFEDLKPKGFLCC